MQVEEMEPPAPHPDVPPPDGSLHRQPRIRWPMAAGPFRNYDTYGWEWSDGVSLDENLMRLAYAIRYNCSKIKGYTSGRCSAVICRPQAPGAGPLEEIEILAFGVNAPPRFQPSRRVLDLSGEGAELERAAARERAARLNQDMGYAEVHAEVQAIGRCAREGIRVRGSWVYVSLPPCWECFKTLLAAGVSRVVLTDLGAELADRQRRVAEDAGLEWVVLPKNLERQPYVDELWDRWKAENGLSRKEIKAMETEAPL